MRNGQSRRVILLAHGSTDPHWQRTFEELASPALARSPHAVLAHMELCEPSLETAVAEAVEQGYEAITVLPLFLARGRHLRKDIPAMIEELRTRYGIAIELTAPIGEHPLLAETLGHIVTDFLEASRKNKA